MWRIAYQVSHLKTSTSAGDSIAQKKVYIKLIWVLINADPICGMRGVWVQSRSRWLSLQTNFNFVRWGNISCSLPKQTGNHNYFGDKFSPGSETKINYLMKDKSSLPFSSSRSCSRPFQPAISGGFQSFSDSTTHITPVSDREYKIKNLRNLANVSHNNVISISSSHRFRPRKEKRNSQKQ